MTGWLDASGKPTVPAGGHGGHSMPAVMSTEDVDKLKAARADRRGGVLCDRAPHRPRTSHAASHRQGRHARRATLSSRDRQRLRRVVRPVDLVEARTGRVALGGQDR